MPSAFEGFWPSRCSFKAERPGHASIPIDLTSQADVFCADNLRAIGLRPA